MTVETKYQILVLRETFFYSKSLQNSKTFWGENFMFGDHWDIAYNVKATYNEKIHDGGAKKTTTICLTI